MEITGYRKLCKEEF